MSWTSGLPPPLPPAPLPDTPVWAGPGFYRRLTKPRALCSHAIPSTPGRFRRLVRVPSCGLCFLVTAGGGACVDGGWDGILGGLEGLP